jgi:oxysterol-binding protein 1
MRIAKLHMDSQDKTRFEIQGKSSVKYHLKANHVVEAKRWFWALNNAIQWAKDEEREEERRRTRDAEALRQARIEQSEGRLSETQTEGSVSSKMNGKGLAPPSIHKSNNSYSKLSTHTSRTVAESAPADDDGSAYGSYDPSIAQNQVNRVSSHVTHGPDGDDDYEEYGDGASSRDMQPVNKDALSITAQSAKLQLELLSSISSSLQVEKSKNPNLVISEPEIDQALAAYESAVNSLNGLFADLLKISRDRDSYWQFRLDREVDAHKMWEESMARIVQEHEELETKIGESEDKRKQTKRALRKFLGNVTAPTDAVEASEDMTHDSATKNAIYVGHSQKTEEVPLKQPDICRLSNLSDSDSDDEEFFDAIDAGVVLVEELASPKSHPEENSPSDGTADLRTEKYSLIVPSFQGYENPPRDKLKMEADDRPKISLWASAERMCP